MLCLYGSGAVLRFPTKDTRVDGISEDNCEGLPVLLRRWMGDIWRLLPKEGAVTKSLDWREVEFALYNETFTGRAKPIARCKFCLSEHHIAWESTYAPEMPLHKPESVTSVRSHYDTGKSYTPTCHFFNNKAGNICRFNTCRFGHVCIVCQGTHPASQCRSRPPSPK